MHPLTERYSVGGNNLPGAHPCCQRCSTQTHTRHEAHTDRIITAVCLVTCENTASSIRLFAESSHARHATHIRLVFRRCAAGNVCVFECALRSYIQQQLRARHRSHFLQIWFYPYYDCSVYETSRTVRNILRTYFSEAPTIYSFGCIRTYRSFSAQPISPASGVFYCLDRLRSRAYSVCGHTASIGLLANRVRNTNTSRGGGGILWNVCVNIRIKTVCARRDSGGLVEMQSRIKMKG